MGSALRRMIRDGAPPGWTPLMRLVACEIADDARDPAETGTPDGSPPWSAIPVAGYRDRRGRWREGLTERTGATERGVSHALTRLARAGYEMREQIGTDKRGRPVFTARGHAMRFRVPPLPPRPPVDNPGKVADPCDLSPRKGGGSVHERSHKSVSKVADPCDPIPSVVPPLSPQGGGNSPYGAEVEGGSDGQNKISEEDERRRQHQALDAWAAQQAAKDRRRKP